MAHDSGKAMAAFFAATFVTPVCSHAPLTQGVTAMATKAENQTANRVAALWRGIIRRISAAHTQMALPSSRESSNRSAKTSAIVLSALMMSLLAPFQQLPHSRQFLSVNAALFQNIQEQAFMGISEKSADKVTDFKAGRVLQVDFGHIDV